MKIIHSQSFLRKLSLTTILFGLFFSMVSTVHAGAEYVGFIPDITLNPNCQVVATFDLVVVPASVTPGNSFFLKIQKLDANNETILEDDFLLTLPLNGELFDHSITAQAFVGPGDYRVSIIENNPNNELVSQGQFYTLEIPDEGNCTGNNQQQQNNTQPETPNGGGPTEGPMDIPISNPINIPTIPFLIQRILEIILKIGVPLLVVMIIYSGALYLFAQGNASKISSAHTMFIYTLIGGAILLGAWALSELIYTTLIEITAFDFSLIHHLII